MYRSRIDKYLTIFQKYTKQYETVYWYHKKKKEKSWSSNVILDRYPNEIPLFLQ